jgi:hypothetical protein
MWLINQLHDKSIQRQRVRQEANLPEGTEITVSFDAGAAGSSTVGSPTGSAAAGSAGSAATAGSATGSAIREQNQTNQNVRILTVIIIGESIYGVNWTVKFDWARYKPKKHFLETRNLPTYPARQPAA